jgi:uncharacterized membrane protein YdjX (TVP38/TMEM64 family)
VTTSKNAVHTGNETAGRIQGKILLLLAAGALVLLVLAWFGRDAGDEIKTLETWIAGLGILAPLVFTAVVVILTSVFVPSTLLSAVAGTLFGLGCGTLVMSAGAIVGAALNYWVAHKLLGNRIADVLQRHPKLQAIQRAVQGRGLRLQFMLRLVPVNTVSVNYVLGAAGVRFPTFLTATVGLIPGLFVEVYFGYVAKHITKTVANVTTPSTLHHALTIGGFLVCVILMVSIGRMAQRALEEAEAETSAEL